MTTFNARVAAMAARQRDRFGTAALTFTKVTPGALTASTGKRAETTSTATVKATRRPVEPEFITAGPDRRPADRAEFVVLASDLSGAGLTPEEGDRFTDADGKVWTINQVGHESDRVVVVLRASIA